MTTHGTQSNEMMECSFMTLPKEDIDWANYSPMPLGALGPRGLSCVKPNYESSLMSLFHYF